MDLFWVLWMITAYPRWQRPDLHFFSCLQGWKHYSSESYRLLRRETGSNVTGDTFVGSKHHSPLHKLGLAEFPIEKVLENTRHVKLKRTCPQHAIVCVCVCVCIIFRMEYPVHPERGFHGGSDSKEFACNARDLGLIPGSGICPGEGNGYPFQYSCLESPINRGTWGFTVCGVTKSWPRLSD